jgi:Fe-S cluster assembly protein SufD
MNLPAVLDPDQAVIRNLPECRAASEERFHLTPWPARTDEAWRFADLKKSSVEEHSMAARLQIRSGGGSDAGLVDLGLDEALVRHGDVFGPHLEEALGRLGAAKHLSWGLKSDRLAGHGWVVPEGVRVTAPVIVDLVAGGAGHAAVLNLLLVRRGASVLLWERFVSGASDSVFVVAGTVVVAEEGADVTLVTSQELSRSSKLVNCVHVVPGPGARARTFSLNFGAGWVRQEVSAGLASPGAECELFGLSLVGAGEEVDQRTQQAHQAGGIRSNLLFKNCLFADARSIFSGLIRVDEGAHGTDAFQTCRNLLLSDEAEANSMPGLEINADQVRCSHGATCGQIDPEEVFYLRSRGIPEGSARRLVTLGFARDIVSRVGHEKVEAELDRRLEARLSALHEADAQDRSQPASGSRERSIPA